MSWVISRRLFPFGAAVSTYHTRQVSKVFMKWFPAGRFVNDIMGRWHDNPKSRVPVDVRDCARGSIGRLVRFFAQCPCTYPALVLVFSLDLDLDFVCVVYSGSFFGYAG